ncbi:sigma-70 family RNA polymerase sigma factor [Bacillus sp. BRMEA1]|uniref:sigma-70 family RNA polymerase sigma factor n=1 Tax=Neobacillus endophyticus TaxID=2738405 RepID=UPI0015642729|nr:sigma-70 family RNA polymerase sigma factor [Neobacillus endophyticus]NRD79464.1 sigma-70 family RNA polymerase sigma factor [Neobacillus endophyticus]
MSISSGDNIYDQEQQVEDLDEGFWMEHYPKLQRYCHFLAQNPWDGDDIAHETYLKALKYCTQKNKLSSALLNKIAYHHWIDQLRKRKNEKIGAEDELAQGVMLYDFDEMAHSVDLLLKLLTPKQAIIFLLKESFQYQGKEIAHILGTTEMAVKASLNRAKKRLAKEERQTSSVETFWNEEEREQLEQLFYSALKNQDPSILIKSISTIISLRKVPNVIIENSGRTPSSTLCMAA